MEHGHGPFIDGLPIKTSIYKGFSMVMLNNQRVYIYINMSYRHLETSEFKMIIYKYEL